ncbi:MAG: hypothetical protein ACLTG4_07115 [Oscillospiraceae bacterium]
MRRYNGEEAKLRGNIEALRPWQTLDLPLDLGETVRTRISLGMLPAAVDLAEAAKALADAAPESQLYEISSIRNTILPLICLKELTEATALRASGFTPANLSGTPGTANRTSRMRSRSRTSSKREQAETDAAFASGCVQACIDRASVSSAARRRKSARRHQASCMRGWLTAPEEENSPLCSQSMIAPGIWPIPRRTSTPRCRSNSKTTNLPSR